MPSPRVLAVDSGAGHAACAFFTTGKSGQLVLQQVAVNQFVADPAHEAQWAATCGRSLAALGRTMKPSGAVVLVVPGHHALTKFVKTPAIARAQREKILAFEAQQNIPYPLTEVVWDHLTVDDHGADLEVMLTAVKSDVVEELCAAAATAGFEPERVQPSGVALWRAYAYNYPDASERALIVSVGARSTNLLFVEGARFFVRTIALAGNSVTQHIAEELKQDFAAAESLKLQVLGGRAPLPETSPARQAVMAAAHSFVGRLHLEITRSTVNYRRQSGADQPQRVFLTGGGSLLPQLEEELGEKLKLPVTRLDPLRRVELSAAAEAGGARELAHGLTDLVGLAAPSPSAVAALNLLPRARGEARTFRRRQPYLIAAAVALAGATLLPGLHHHAMAVAAREKVAELDGRIRPLAALRDRNDENLERIAAARRQMEALHGLVATKSNWINFFSDLQDRLGQVGDVWLEKLQVTREAAPAGRVAGAAAGLFAAGGAPADGEVSADAPLRLNLTGRLIDRANPVSRVSHESYHRVKALLGSFVDSQFISAVEGERFDADQPGILRFDFVLVVDPAHPL